MHDDLIEHAHAVEIEALRQQRDFLVEEYERAVGCGQQGYTHAAMHLFNAITNAQVDQNANAIMALRAEVEDYSRRAVHEAERACAAEVQAERLAEALRDATTMLMLDYPETAKRLRAVLNPTTEQEG